MRSFQDDRKKVVAHIVWRFRDEFLLSLTAMVLSLANEKIELNCFSSL